MNDHPKSGKTKEVKLLQQESTDEAILYKKRSPSTSPMGDNATLKKYGRCTVLLKYIISFENILEETGSEVPGAGEKKKSGKIAEGMQQEKEKNESQ